MSYRVTAPLVLARDKEGKVHERYQDAVIDWLDDDQKRHFLESELVVEAGAPAAVDEPAGGEVEKPAKVANKPELIAWLVDNAAHDDGSDFTADELEPKTKDELWELIDAVG